MSGATPSTTTTTDATDATDATQPKPYWDNVDPEIMLAELKGLNTDAIGTTNKKPLPKSYKSWATMSIKQKETVLNFYYNLSLAIRAAVDGQAEERTKLDAATASAISNLQSPTGSAGGRNSNEPPVTKDDHARLLALRQDPASAMLWAATQTPMDRRHLDARHSSAAPSGSGGSSMADQSDPWGGLAERFMDYEEFTPQNVLLQHELRGGVSVPIKPFRAASPEIASLAAACRDINPTNKQRAHIMRSGAWIKDKWTPLKSILVQVFISFNRSGQQTGRDEAEVEWMSDEECRRWCFHSGDKNRHHPDVNCYAYAIMEKADFASMGKEMPKGAGRDSSMLGSGEGSAAAGNKKRKKDNKKSKKGKADKQSKSSNDGGIGAALQKAGTLDARVSATQFLAVSGPDSQTRGAAISRLTRFSKTGALSTPSQSQASRSPPAPNPRSRSTAPAASSSSSGHQGDRLRDAQQDKSGTSSDSDSDD